MHCALSSFHTLRTVASGQSRKPPTVCLSATLLSLPYTYIGECRIDCWNALICYEMSIGLVSLENYLYANVIMCLITVSQTLPCVLFHPIPCPVFTLLCFAFPPATQWWYSGGEWLSANNRALSAVNTHRHCTKLAQRNNAPFYRLYRTLQKTHEKKPSTQRGNNAVKTTLLLTLTRFPLHHYTLDSAEHIAN